MHDTKQKDLTSLDLGGGAPIPADNTVRSGCEVAWIIFLVTVMAALCAGCQSPEAGSARREANARAGTPSYLTNLVHEGDVLSISFESSTNYNTLQKVALDGSINLEVAGKVQMAGRTTSEVELELRALYERQVKEDPIRVRIMETTASVYVCGAVLRPGRVALARPMTALEAVMEAGGFDTLQARLSRVSVVRVEAGKQRSYAVDLRRALTGSDPRPFYLHPFDIVYVPVKTWGL